MKNKTPAKPKRKILLIIVLIVLAGPALLAGGLFWKWNNDLANTFDKVAFTNELPIPKLASSQVVDGTHTFDLELQKGQTEFFPGSKTDTWGVNGSYLGPTLRIKRGEQVQMNVRNSLAQTSNLHWHGMHLPAVMDGGPHQSIESGATWSPTWKVNQPAATLWYHPHPHGVTRKHVYMGLAGMIIVDDDNPTHSKLPHDYGVDDIPVIIQDKKFTSDKQLSENDTASVGMTGKDILVNGALTPHFNAKTESVRLRLLNGSNARTYHFGLSNNQDLTLIATDGGLLEKPTGMNRLTLSPGERAEVIVRVSPGENFALRSYPLKLSENILDQRGNGNDDSLEIMQIRGARRLTASRAIPGQLSTIQKLVPRADSPVRNFDLLGISINGKSMDMERVDFSATEGNIETWKVTNKADGPHNFHIHDVLPG